MFLYKKRSADPPIVSADYAVFRDRVTADGGSIANAPACLASINYLLANPALAMVQWLDTRFGVQANPQTKWYSICGAPADAYRTAYAAPILAVDAVSGSPIWVYGALDGGSIPELTLSDNYTWGMKLWQVTPGASGYLWGNRYGGTGWNYMLTSFWRSYWGYDCTMNFSMPMDQWLWVWLVKDGATVTLYDEANTVLATNTLQQSIAPLPLGIAGSTQSDGVNDSHLRYERFFRAASALTAAQRAAIQAI